MKPDKLFILLTGLAVFAAAEAQNTQVAGANPDNWTVFNREAVFEDDVIHLNAQANDGVLWLDGSHFKSGTIGLGIKGKNAPGKSFVGVAFHGSNDTTFDAVYFRPFNFKIPERNAHSVQYISMPENPWYVLRKAFPGKYEHTVNPVPDPDGWFHVQIVVSSPHIKVYVNRSESPALEVDQITDRDNGKVGLWVGNGSEGWFKNLTITEDIQ